MAEKKGGVGGLLGFFRDEKHEEEKPKDPKAPLPVYNPSAPPYSAADSLYPIRIKYKGIYDLDGLYKTMANWLRQRRYELHENLYKARPPELEIRMRAERPVNGFVKEAITIYYHSWGEYDVEVTVDGKKKKMTNARMILTLNGEIEAPYRSILGERRWTATNLERWLLRLMQGWFMRRELESVYVDTLYYELYQFHGVIKDFLKMEARGNVY